MSVNLTWQVFIAQSKAFARFVMVRFADIQLPRMAAGLSYSTALAIVPLMAFAFAMFAAFPMFENMRTEVEDAIFTNLLPEMSESVVREHLNQFVNNTKGLTAIGLIGLLPSAILILATIETALNRIFRVKQPRPWRSRILVFWSLLTLGPIMLGVSFGVATYVNAMTKWVGIDGVVTSVGFMTRMVPTLMVMVALGIFFLIVPNRRVSFRGAFAGGVVASLLFALLRWSFSLYAARSGTYDTIYGALSIIPMFLVWMYMSWMVILFGGVIAAAATDWIDAGGDPGKGGYVGAHKLTIAMRLLDCLFQTSKQGGATNRRKILAASGTDEGTMRSALEDLQKTGYAQPTKDGGWVLARDLESVKLYDLFRDLGLVLTIDGDDAVKAAWQRTLDKKLTEIDDVQGRLADIPLREIMTEKA